MNLSQAPEQGIMYALYRNKVVYQPYIRENLMLQEDEEKNLLELHLFDVKEAYNDCVEVVNYITYDENDLMTIQNYRLKEVQ